MLKPRDLARVEFKRVFRGYNEKEVDEFVQKVVGEYETLYQRYQELEEENRALKARVQKFEESEGQFEEALALARQVARDLKSAAEHKANAIVSEARAEAANILRRAREEVEAHAARVTELTRQEEAFRNRFRELLESYWTLLEEERREAEHLTHTVRALAEAAASIEILDKERPGTYQDATRAERSRTGEPDRDAGTAARSPEIGRRAEPEPEPEPEPVAEREPEPEDEPEPEGPIYRPEWELPLEDLEETRRLPALGGKSEALGGKGEGPRGASAPGWGKADSREEDY
ncbi:MAG: hypothetical protein BAA04_00775 [Firmicutes bacterium ZCTH02-B6]|nr:MAG: hypothetical protein BAA04_00775 [Firmicutes bacterium ZCTH02-B6]